MQELKKCPCGSAPKSLQINAQDRDKWAFVSGDCCGEWSIEYRNNYARVPSEESTERAREAWNNAPREALRQRPVDRPDFYYRYDRIYGHRVITVSEYESWGRHCRKEDTYSPAYLSPTSAQWPVVDNDVYCDNVLDPLWRDYGEDSVQYQTALAAYRQMRHRPVVDDARMARALEWIREATEGDAECAEHLPAIEEAIAAYDPNCGGRTVRVVDDAMVERALHSAYYAGWCNAARWADRTDLVCDEGSAAYARDRDVGLALTKTALLAAYQQDNGGK